MDVRIEQSWKQALSREFSLPYFNQLVSRLKEEREKGKRIFPAGADIFKAFELTTLEQVKVVLLGQDPYHQPGQAHGLAFSVNDQISPPPSLQNIYKELAADLGCAKPASGNLRRWAEQGVLLLNAALTVEAGAPMSHAAIGWHEFTNAVLQTISDQKEHVVFLLWGAFAKSKQGLIDPSKHLILCAAHPSPLSAHNGFFGCRHFSKANAWLMSHGIAAIDWSLA